MKVTIAQLNSIVGDLEGNFNKICKALDVALNEKSDLLVLPELFLVGYPARDLLEKKWFINSVTKYIDKICEVSNKYSGIGILFGAPRIDHDQLYNSAVLINDGKIKFVQHKSLLPTYDVFDETRYFSIAKDINVVDFKGETLGVSVCEDAWNYQEKTNKKYDIDPIDVLANAGATLIINISASPFQIDKEKQRYAIMKKHAKKHSIPFVYANMIGGNDEIIFDGRSMCLNKHGEFITLLPSFEENIKTIDIREQETVVNTWANNETDIFDALVLGVKDYLNKCGFTKAIIGLSGGIDSALTAVIAKEALGQENVIGISMPSPYSSKGSVDDSKVLAENLGIDFKVIGITETFDTYLETLAPYFADTKQDVTEENIQARIRGNILMAFSNKYGYIVLNTGNKSEMAVGYCTLYGDLSGGLSVLSDVPKTMVYEICEYINKDKEIIPETIIKKPPSAELRPDQKDQDSLPSYEVLDGILKCYIEEGMFVKEIVDQGYDREIVKWIINTVNRNEYKRRQAAPGIKVTSKAFGVGRRYAIASRVDVG
jgi:NAD+ synthase (glutamine-hydrolysing)